MTDRELLEYAAKAAGIELYVWGSPGAENFANMASPGWRWNPLLDDGDALRLAVQLRLNLNFEEWDGTEYACADPHRSHQGQDEVIDDDENAATRRAIVRAAAEIGKAPTPTPHTKEPT